MPVASLRLARALQTTGQEKNDTEKDSMRSDRKTTGEQPGGSAAQPILFLEEPLKRRATLL